MSEADDPQVQTRALRFAFDALLRALDAAAPEVGQAFRAEIQGLSRQLDASDFPDEAEVLRLLAPARE